jgi:uncharacterized protein (PEP-CTERM system associated)
MAKQYGPKKFKRDTLPLTAPIAILAVLMAPQARADWKSIASVEARENYTDNAGLMSASNGDKRGQFISELSPTLSIANNGPRLKLNASIVDHLFAYSGYRPPGTRSSVLQLDANAHAKLVEELLFVDAASSVGQRPVSAFGPQNVNGYSGVNSDQVRTYRISPYVANRFGETAKSELRFTRDSVQTGNAGFADSKSNTALLSLASGQAFRTLLWNLQYSRQQIDYAIGRNAQINTALANFQYRLIPTFGLTANIGHDKYDYQALGGVTAGKTYALGFSWTPSQRTSIQANAGRHYYGKTYSLVANHRSRSTVWSVNYGDSITSSRDQFLLPAAVNTADMLDRLFSSNIPDPIARQQAVDAYIRATGLPPQLTDSINYFSNRFFLQKQFVASTAFNMPKTTAIVSFNATQRNALSSQQSDSTLLGSSLSSLNDNTKQKGATLLVNHRVNSRTGVNLTLNKSHTESLTTGIVSNQQLISLSLTRQLQPKLKGAVEVHRNQGTFAVQSGSKYTENAVSASLSLQL